MSDRRWSPRRPTTKRGLALTIAGGLAVVAVAAFAFVYFVLFPTSSPPKFTLRTTAANAAAHGSTGSATQIAGSWKVAEGSQAGYRVREKLAMLPAQSQAVGRTSAITGTATLVGSDSHLTVAKTAFVVDVSTLQSDQSIRDEKIHVIGLESDRYPQATFTLATPIHLPPGASTGRAVDVPATGALTIHGVTRTVTIPVEMRVSPTQIEAVGSTTFPWGRFDMTAPSVGGFVTVTNSATMEFDLKLARS